MTGKQSVEMCCVKSGGGLATQLPKIICCLQTFNFSRLTDFRNFVIKGSLFFFLFLFFFNKRRKKKSTDLFRISPRKHNYVVIIEVLLSERIPLSTMPKYEKYLHTT